MIVKDINLQKLIQQSDNPLLTNYDVPNSWTSKDSLVQPSSIDLHIGEIFRPGVKPGKAGSADRPKSELVLKTGETAVVVTQESIHLAGDYAGYGFPPAHVSSRALLMTNPGHVDPGYSGQLQCTVINMGREDFTLRSRDLIMTLLIHKLDGPVGSDYSARHGGPTSKKITQSDLDRLSPDFVDVKKRATSIARRTLSFATVGAGILALILGWAFNAVDKRLNGIDDMKMRLTRLEAVNSSLERELQATKEQLETQMALDQRLTIIESQNKSRGASK
jgi:dCTP deaminase